MNNGAHYSNIAHSFVANCRSLIFELLICRDRILSQSRPLANGHKQTSEKKSNRLRVNLYGSQLKNYFTVI